MRPKTCQNKLKQHYENDFKIENKKTKRNSDAETMQKRNGQRSEKVR